VRQEVNRQHKELKLTDNFNIFIKKTNYIVDTRGYECYYNDNK